MSELWLVPSFAVMYINRAKKDQNYVANSCNVCIAGISSVLNLKFSPPSFSTIMWDPPPTVGVLSNLTYHLTVTNMNTGVVIINNTTTDTSYPLSSVQLRTYNASVTAFSHDQCSDAETISKRIPGGK